MKQKRDTLINSLTVIDGTKKCLRFKLHNIILKNSKTHAFNGVFCCFRTRQLDLQQKTAQIVRFFEYLPYLSVQNRQCYVKQIGKK